MKKLARKKTGKKPTSKKTTRKGPKKGAKKSPTKGAKKKTKKKASAKTSAKGKTARETTEFHRPDYRTNITEDELIRNLDEDLQDAWFKLREFTSRLGPQRIYASGWAIMFAKKACYVFVRPKKKYLETCIFLPYQIDSSEIKSARPVSKTKYANILRLIHADQVEEPLTDWITEAYAAMPESE